ncbi:MULTISPECIES: TIGR02281 family clan AA aspartic protease [unclassified Sphingomonas]|uniref:retropepsin-like aspartic protease family protein n=1 Tax=unclassified Sphingomonas TaxID=196159 RepID=UPI001F5A9410|nr:MULTISPECIES: TIGR02281 family clan AA aspartic protease [unclassified Sphingomonas]
MTAVHDLIAHILANRATYVPVLLIAIAFVVALRLPVVGSVLRFGITVALFAVLVMAIGQHSRIDPYLGRLTRALGMDTQQVVGRETRIRIAPDGHFWAKVRINGVERRLLVDSGATTTALSARTAAAAGLTLREGLVPVVIRTANGDVGAQSADVATLRLGDVTARDLAVVVSPAFGDLDVLGMNFLSRLKSWRVEDGTLILEPHHPIADGGA